MICDKINETKVQIIFEITTRKS